MKYTLRSLLVHAVIVLFFGVLTITQEHFIEDIPIEITEFMSHLGEVSENKLPVKKSSSSEKTSSAQNVNESGPAQSTSVKGSPQGVDEGVAEDYEVSEMPLLLNEVRVPYPAEAKQKKIQGGVVFNILISSEGFVRDIQLISSPDPSLTQAAENAVRLFKFRPAKMAQKPVAIRIRYTYRFLIQ